MRLTPKSSSESPSVTGTLPPEGLCCRPDSREGPDLCRVSEGGWAELTCRDSVELVALGANRVGMLRFGSPGSRLLVAGYEDGMVRVHRLTR